MSLNLLISSLLIDTVTPEWFNYFIVLPAKINHFCLPDVVLKVFAGYPKNIANLSENFLNFFHFLVFHSYNKL